MEKFRPSSVTSYRLHAEAHERLEGRVAALEGSSGAGGGGAGGALGDLSDVSLVDPAGGDVLVYTAGKSEYEKIEVSSLICESGGEPEDGATYDPSIMLDPGTTGYYPYGPVLLDMGSDVRPDRIEITWSEGSGASALGVFWADKAGIFDYSDFAGYEEIIEDTTGEFLYDVPKDSGEHRYWGVFNLFPIGYTRTGGKSLMTERNGSESAFVSEIRMTRALPPAPGFWSSAAPAEGGADGAEVGNYFPGTEITLDDLVPVFENLPSQGVKGVLNPGSLYMFTGSDFLIIDGKHSSISIHQNAITGSTLFSGSHAIAQVGSEQVTFKNSMGDPVNLYEVVPAKAQGIVVGPLANSTIAGVALTSSDGTLTLASKQGAKYRLFSKSAEGYIGGIYYIDGEETWYTEQDGSLIFLGNGSEMVITTGPDYPNITLQEQGTYTVPDATIGMLQFRSSVGKYNRPYVDIGLNRAEPTGQYGSVVIGYMNAPSFSDGYDNVFIGTGNGIAPADSWGSSNIAIGSDCQMYSDPSARSGEEPVERVVEDGEAARIERSKEAAQARNSARVTHNIAIGDYSQQDLDLDATGNIAIGYRTMLRHYGNYNIAIGHDVDYASGWRSWDGTVSLGTDSGGKGARAMASNEIALGTANHHTVIRGRLTTTTPTADMHAATKKYVDDAIAAATAALQAEVAELRARLGEAPEGPAS